MGGAISLLNMQKASTYLVWLVSGELTALSLVIKTRIMLHKKAKFSWKKIQNFRQNFSCNLTAKTSQHFQSNATEINILDVFWWHFCRIFVASSACYLLHFKDLRKLTLTFQSCRKTFFNVCSFKRTLELSVVIHIYSYPLTRFDNWEPKITRITHSYADYNGTSHNPLQITFV